MEIAGAEVEALREILSDDDIDSKVHIPLPETSKTNFVKEYVQKHDQSYIETNTSEPNSDLIAPVSHTVSEVKNSLHSFTLTTTPITGMTMTSKSL